MAQKHVMKLIFQMMVDVKRIALQLMMAGLALMLMNVLKMQIVEHPLLILIGATMEMISTMMVAQNVKLIGGEIISVLQLEAHALTWITVVTVFVTMAKFVMMETLTAQDVTLNVLMLLMDTIVLVEAKSNSISAMMLIQQMASQALARNVMMEIMTTMMVAPIT